MLVDYDYIYFRQNLDAVTHVLIKNFDPKAHLMPFHRFHGNQFGCHTCLILQFLKLLTFNFITHKFINKMSQKASLCLFLSRQNRRLRQKVVKCP